MFIIKTRKRTLFLVQAAVIAAAYTALTYFASALNLAYGPVQFRFSEALTILPVFTPAAIPGLTIGCLLGNIGSTLSWPDMVFGPLASLLAAICSYYTRKFKWKGLPVLSPLFPVIVNAVIIGLVICVFYTKNINMLAFLTAAGEVALGQVLMCYGLGLPLHAAMKKVPFFSKLNSISAM